ncbi:MAG: DNA repair protein RecN, partial [bacterium]
AEGRLDVAVASLERALVEAGEARNAVDTALGGLEFEPRRLEEVEERLFALRALARKHSVPADDLPRLREEIAGKLDALQSGEEGIAGLEEQVREARAAYEAAARALSEKRAAAAKRLNREVARELKPLKLERAAFRTAIDKLPEDRQGPEGMDRVRFEVATNPGAPFGDLKQIASGGELSRFILALKVALAARGSAATLIFDEVDRGVGGAVADAVGERLARLAESGAQVLVVTHSPQVAARAGHHWRIEKAEKKGRMTTDVTPLGEAARREEVARMLAAAEITDEARAAAARLLQAGAEPSGPVPARKRA